MTQVSKRLPVLMAALIGMAIAFAVWGAAPNAVFADDDEEVFELDQIEIQSDGALGEGQKFILLDDKNGIVSWGDLGVVVNDQGGNPVADSEYDLQLQAVWYSDTEGKDHLEDVTDEDAFGLMGDEASSGCTEYRLTATPAENSSYVGKASLSFYLVDRTSLSYICSEISFKDPAKVTGWRMRGWYWFWAGDPIVSEVRAECGSADDPLTESVDYTVTYYKHKENVDIYSGGPEEDFLGAMVEDEYGDPAVPTEPGDYFAVIKGKGDYYGGSMFPVSIMGDDQIMFKPENDQDLWSNGEKKYTLTKASGVVGDSVSLTVGFRDGDNWKTKFQNGEDYTYDPTTSTLTLIGKKIITEENKDSWLCLSAQIGEGDSVLRGEEFVQLRLAESRYEEPDDVELLPGWEKNIDSVHCFVRDQQHFDGEGFDQPITGARILSQNPATGNVLELWHEENGEWKYRAKNPGQAYIEIEFYDPLDSSVVVCGFNVTVSDTVYEVNLWSEENIYKGFPGDEIVLFAWGEKKWVVQDGGNPDNWHEEGTSDNLAYKWEITEGDDFATLSKDENEPYRAVLKFNPMPAGWDSIGERVKVKVSIREDSDDVNTERAANENDFSVEDDYYQIYPTTINTNLLLGETTELKPELRHYQLGKDFSVVDNVEFEINNYDDNAIEVGGGNGTFTIKRLQQWDTNFSVRANWNGGDPEEQWYHLNGKHYRAEFGFGDVDVYDDYHVTLTPEIQDGEELNADDYEVTYRLGRFEWNEENEAYDTEFEVDADSGVYEVNGKSITIYGDKLAALGRNNLEELRIIAHLKINGIDCEDTDCWINSRESCTTWGHKHNWIKGIAKQPTFDEVGYEVWICPGFMVLEGCGETRLWEIPKLIDIADATVAVKNQTYTGKALKPALTVTYGGKTLEAGTDYTATYTNNTKVGTATVTLKGIGTAKVTPEGQDYPDLFGGMKKATFKIVKAKNPMVVKTKAVTLKAKDVKKKNQTIKQTAAFAVTKNQGKVTYKKKSGDAKITIASNGTITVKKGLKKGKYKFVVNVTAAGNANYKKITKAATVDITVK